MTFGLEYAIILIMRKGVDAVLDPQAPEISDTLRELMVDLLPAKSLRLQGLVDGDHNGDCYEER